MWNFVQPPPQCMYRAVITPKLTHVVPFQSKTLPQPNPWQPLICLTDPLQFCLFQNAIIIESHNTSPFETVFLHLGRCLWDLSMLLYVTIFTFFFLYSMAYSSNHLLTNVWVDVIIMTRAAIICAQFWCE